MSAFTSTSGPGSGIYEDTHGVKWSVWVDFPGITAIDGPYVAALVSPAYGQKAGVPLVTSLLFANAKGNAANKSLVLGVEDWVYRHTRGGGGSWLWLVVIGYLVTRKGKR